MNTLYRGTRGSADEAWNDGLIARALVQVHTCACSVTLWRCLQCRLARLLLLRAEEGLNDVPRERKPPLEIVCRGASPSGMQTVTSSSEPDFGPNGDLGFGALTLREPDDATNKELAMDIDRDIGIDMSTDLEINFDTDLQTEIDINLVDVDMDVDMDVDTDVDMAIDMDVGRDMDIDFKLHNFHLDIDMD